MEKIKMTTPLVEMDGDEMTRIKRNVEKPQRNHPRHVGRNGIPHPHSGKRH